MPAETIPTGLSTLIIAALALVCLPARAGDECDPALLTVAEKSGFRVTARYEEIVALLDRLAVATPTGGAAPLARKTDLGHSGEGRLIPGLIIADPPVATPDEAARFVASGEKLLVLAIGNIHAGEVDGKEALPMVARELLTTPHHPLLKDLIVVVAPIYNCDGNERVSKDNRPGQAGPEEGMGQRENATGLDLNRDFVKLTAPETRGLVGFLNRWDPAIFIDCHTTNGCFHRYVITYEGPKAPAGDVGLIEYGRERMMPAIAHDMNERYRVPSFIYGDFNAEHTTWDTYPAHARYGTSYVGLRGRISVLSEGYSYSSYQTRVLGTRDFVKSILEYAAAHRKEIHELLRDVDQRTITAASSHAPLALRSKTIAAPKKVTAAGFVEEKREGKIVSTGTPKDYEITLMTHYESTLTTARPWAYAIPADQKVVLENLANHGIRTTPLPKETAAAAEVYKITKVERAERPFQNVRLVSVQAESRSEQRSLPAGMVLVETAQPLGNLVSYLLEPMCEDGLTTWGFFDDALAEGKDFPVLRVVKRPD